MLNITHSPNCVVGSTETESDEEDYLAGLTRQMAGSSHGSLNGSSPPSTWDLLYEAAGEVERTIRFEPVWKGKKPNRTKPKLIGLNRFSVRFGSKN
jgi:hypothetical protein